MKKIFLAIGSGSLFLGTLLFVPGCQRPESRPNVIIMITDDQGYGDLSCLGNPVLKTPHLDKLHGESVRFTDFHVAPVCTPTRGMLLTGLDAMRNGAWAWAYGRETIQREIKDTLGNTRGIHTMAEYFKANGYKTGHFGKWHLGDMYPYRPQDKGFDRSVTFGGADINQTPSYMDNDCFDDFYSDNGIIRKFKGYCTDIWFDETVEFIKESTKEQHPFFIYLPTNAMHTPVFVDPSYAQPYEGLLPEENRHYLLAERFFGMITNFDDNVGRLDQFLDQQGLKENTIVIYLTDNGGTFGVDIFNAGMQGMKGSLFEGGHRVPCFIRWPDGTLGNLRDIDQLTVVQDLLPTLINICKLEDPWKESFDGLDLTPLLARGRQTELSERIAVVQYNNSKPGAPHAVLWNKWRYVHRKGLFNVEEDPGQNHDLSGEFPDILEHLETYYQSWRAGVQPVIDQVPYFPVGHPDADTVFLTCNDWVNIEGEGNVTQQYEVRQGKSMRGTWNLNFVSSDSYSLSFSRWPREIETPIRSGIPVYYTEAHQRWGIGNQFDHKERVDWKSVSIKGLYPEGKKLPIRYMSLTMDSLDYREILPVSEDDLEITFRLQIPAAKSDVKAVFLDEQKLPVCGAYYGYFNRL